MQTTINHIRQSVPKPIRETLGNPLTNRDHSIAAQVGNTPLFLLNRIRSAAKLSPEVCLFAKAEWFNASGSVKDRPALNIIRTAEENGLLGPGSTILDSTSGNMGIAYAMLGIDRGYQVLLAIPSNASKERIAVLKAYGAELIFTDPLEGSDGAIHHAKELAAQAPNSVFYADQYNNPANWQAHYYTTAFEIWSQTQGRVSHFVAGLGTSGTFMGTSRRLRELNPSIHTVAVQPDSPFHGLEGLKHMPTSIQPGIYNASAPDQQVTVQTEKAYEMARLLAQQEGLFVGISAAAAVVAAVELGNRLTQGVIVTMLPDNGLKYLSESFWEER